MIKDVTDLQVYTLALNLLEPIYKITNLLPLVYRRIKYQTNGAAETIAPLIAEGFAKKKSPREFCRFLAMALGSSDEVITHLREIKIVAKTVQKISIKECDDLIEQYKILSKKLNKLHAAWEKFD